MLISLVDSIANFFIPYAMATRVPEEKSFIISRLQTIRRFQSPVKLAGRAEKLPIAEEGKNRRERGKLVRKFAGLAEGA
jgi:hypothetical protein